MKPKIDWCKKLLVGLSFIVSLEGVAVTDEKVNSMGNQGGIIILRHGQGEQNAADVFNTNPKNKGYKIANLTEKGRDQAQATAKQLKAMGVSADNVCKLVVSPLPRTRQTSEIVMDSLSIPFAKREINESIIESDMGDREGKSVHLFKEKDTWFPADPKSFNGETREEISRRVSGAIDSILNDPDCNLSKQYVLVVSHGVPIYLMLEYLTGKGEKLNTAEFREIPYEVLSQKKLAKVQEGN